MTYRPAFFYDQFTGPDLDRHWYREGASAGGYGLEKFTSDPDLVTVQGGNLVVSAMRNPDSSWRGGMVSTRNSVLLTEGTVEVRAKLPTTVGVWPAIWLMNDVDGSRGGNKAEIDIMELFPGGGVNGPGAYFTIHDWTQTPQGGGNLPPHVGVQDGKWHVWKLILTATSMQLLIDGISQGGFTSEDTKPWPWSKHPMYLVLNMAVGGSWPGAIVPAASTQRLDMRVDYVKIS